jgi:DivIVA domain-containing protein
VETIERIRNATFTLTRRGYDRREVDSYLAKLSDWLEGGGADQVHGDTIQHELERIGRRTAKILTSAEEAAQALQADAKHEARQITEDARARVESTRTSADEYARKVRDEAQGIVDKAREEAEEQSRKLRSEVETDTARGRKEAEEHAKRVRSEADNYAAKVRSEADEKVKEAEAKAIRMVEEGAARRRQMEKVIADLQARREAVVKGLEKLSTQLAGAASQGMNVGGSEAGSPAAGRSTHPPPNSDSKPGSTPAQPPSAPTRQ